MFVEIRQEKPHPKFLEWVCTRPKWTLIKQTSFSTEYDIDLYSRIEAEHELADLVDYILQNSSTEELRNIHLKIEMMVHDYNQEYDPSKTGTKISITDRKWSGKRGDQNTVDVYWYTYDMFKGRDQRHRLTGPAGIHYNIKTRKPKHRETWWNVLGKCVHSFASVTNANWKTYLKRYPQNAALVLPELDASKVIDLGPVRDTIGMLAYVYED